MNKPYHIARGDCLSLLRGLPDSSVDLVINDPPYGITDNQWDTLIPFDEYWRELNRVCREKAAVLIFASGKFTFKLAGSNFKNYRYKFVWQKNAFGNFLNANRMPLRAYEEICVFYRAQPTYHPIKSYGHIPYGERLSRAPSPSYSKYKQSLINNTDGSRFPTDVLKFPVVPNGNGKKVHPTQKPVQLLEHLIKMYSDEGETVLDPTMGSGSCGVAALNINRCFIGFELQEDYFTTAEQRIAYAAANPKLAGLDLSA